MIFDQPVGGDIQWELVDKMNVPSSSPITAWTVSGLNGNLDGEYYIRYSITQPSYANGRTLLMMTNNTYGLALGGCFLVAHNRTGSWGFNGGNFYLGNTVPANQNNTCYGQVNIYGGQDNAYPPHVVIQFSGDNGSEPYRVMEGGRFTSSSNITSWTLYADTGGFYGKAEFYKKPLG